MTKTNYHTPVLLKESIDALIIDPNGVYVDVTFGGGGHSKEILKRLTEKGKLISFDPTSRSTTIERRLDEYVGSDINYRFEMIQSHL